MTPIPGRQILPITPTCDADTNPTTCVACGRIAIGIGRAIKQGGKVMDPGFLCKKCIVSIGDLTKLDRLSQFELQALDAGVDAVGEWILERGAGTDISVFDELDQRLMVKAAWAGCIEGVRKALADDREAPF